MTICGKNVDPLRMWEQSNRDFFVAIQSTGNTCILSSPVFLYITRGVLRCLLGFLALWGQKPCGGKYNYNQGKYALQLAQVGKICLGFRQLLFTIFGKNLRHIESMTSKVQPAANYWTVDRENLGTRLCFFWWAEKQRAKWRNSFKNGEIIWMNNKALLHEHVLDIARR